MEPSLFLQRIIRPSLGFMREVVPKAFDTPAAEVMLLSIALQESACKYRFQIKGPARGFWQFERRGGFRGVLQHSSSKPIIEDLLLAAALPLDEEQLWGALPYSELAQVFFARLLLWTVPKPLPPIGEQQTAWKYYENTWRPGKPHPLAWAKNYTAAMDAVSYDGG
jgi:hypothetical protein